MDLSLVKTKLSLRLGKLTNAGRNAEYIRKAALDSVSVKKEQITEQRKLGHSSPLTNPTFCLRIPLLLLARGAHVFLPQLLLLVYLLFFRPGDDLPVLGATLLLFGLAFRDLVLLEGSHLLQKTESPLLLWFEDDCTLLKIGLLLRWTGDTKLGSKWKVFL